MALVLGIDTSNYTTSLSLAEDGRILCNLKEPVFVDSGKRGVRQSDAVFSHTKNFPSVSEKLKHFLIGKTIDAVAVSVSPRDTEGSYMPCFMSGYAVANALSAANAIPVYTFSHQRGHIYAALYSSGKRELYGKRFIAFHVSGGTTEALLVDGEKIEIIGGTSDLTAGQLIDRSGVYMGISFPCGRELEALSLKSKKKIPLKLSLNGTYCNMSGAENKVKKMLEEGFSREDVAGYVIDFIRSNLDKLTENILLKYGELPLVFSGGVMSCRSIKTYFESKYGAFFAEPEFSSDNAAGIALLGELKYNSEYNKKLYRSKYD